MAQFVPLDPAFPIIRQAELDASPVVLVNVCTMDASDEAAFLKVWTEDALFMKLQRGNISVQLHRAVGDSPTYLNYAVWESAASWSEAFKSPEFQAKLKAYPPSVVFRPHLFQKVAVPNLCVE